MNARPRSPRTGAIFFALVAFAITIAGCRSPHGEGHAIRPLSIQDSRGLRSVEATTDNAPVPIFGVQSDPPAPGAATLDLDSVLAGVEERFPLILAARAELEMAEGRYLASLGSFDTKFSAKALLEPQGNFEKEVVDVGFSQPLATAGINLFGGYRIGTGDFASYEGKAKTNDNGELRIGATINLLQGREIDPRRVAQWKAQLDIERVTPEIEGKLLATRLKAGMAFWTWLEAGLLLDIAERQVRLAEGRQASIEEAVQEGELAPIAATDNERTIVDRRAKSLAAQRKLEKAAIYLSLFVRDEEGRPVVPTRSQLPQAFPEPTDPVVLVEPDVEARALESRPEPRALSIELNQLELETQLAENQRMARLDASVFVSQDYGSAANSPDDKDELDVIAKVAFELPIQRRKPRGKLRELQGKLAKRLAEMEFVENSIVGEVRDARSALERSWERIAQASRNVELARTLDSAERLLMDEGQSDLFRVNLREQQTATAESALVRSLAEFHEAHIRFRAVTAELSPPGADALDR